LERLLQCGNCRAQWRFETGIEMDPKLTILFLLVGGVIVLSHLNEDNLGRMRRRFAARNWRQLVRRRA
jgi:hypothetical protein